MKQDGGGGRTLVYYLFVGDETPVSIHLTCKEKESAFH